MKASAPNIELQQVSQLIPYINNSRKHSSTQVTQLASSIEHFGLVGAIVIRQGIIAKGHGTLQAIKRLYAAGKLIYPAPGREAGADPYPINTVPVLDCSGWSEAQFKAFVIADNKLALNADWDEEILKLELDSLEQDGFDVLATGFSLEEIEDLALEIDDASEKEERVDPSDNIATHQCPKCKHEWIA